jgi:hypothetical protein
MSAIDVIVLSGDTHARELSSSCRRHGVVRALTLFAEKIVIGF